MRLGIAAFGAVSALTLCAGDAFAAPCANLPNPVYIETGDTQEPLLKNLGRKLRDSAAMPMTLIYKKFGTCVLADHMYKATPQKAVMNYIPSTAENAAWTPASAPLDCEPDATVGAPLDLGIGATFIQSCTTEAPPAGLGLIPGPIQAYGFVVPKTSAEKAITAEEGYFALGFADAAGKVSPWDNDKFKFVATTTKSTSLTLAAALHISPITKLKGQQVAESLDRLNAVIASTDAQKTIGLLGVEVYDDNRDKISLLAFQGFGQRFAYYPDSTATSADKKNVRDGHYLPWAPTIYIAKVDGTGVPTNARVKYLIDLVQGKKTSPAFEAESIDIVADRGLIPDCAMKVSRATEGGNLSLYTPAEPCGCYYDKRNGQTSCTACTDDNACGAGKCRHGYCEAK